MTTSPSLVAHGRVAATDTSRVADIKGAFGSISAEDTSARRSLPAKLKTLLAIVGPGVIVMVGDNDAGAFATYGQAGHTYGTKLLWTFLLLVPVLYVNQEMVLRLGAVTGVGYAKLILERFGRFWGAFSVINLFILNALTIVTEFIGIALAASYLGVPKIVAVILASLVIVVAASTGSLRRFERMAMALCAGSLLLVPLYVLAHPPAGHMASGFVIPSIPGGSGQLGTVTLLIIAIVGTTVAPWQLFFQQSYIIDKRITPRFMRYEKADLWIGIVVVVIGGSALMGATAAAFAGARHGQFTDAAGLASGLAAYAGHAAGALFAVALLDASMIGAFAVSLSTAYAVGDVLGLKHSLHRGVKQAKGFYAMYAALIALAAAIVLIPGSPLGLITVGVQVLAGVLLPSATVFLLLLCNDKEVLGPWVNNLRHNVAAGVVVGVLVMLSAILMISVVFGAVSAGQVIAILAACAIAAALTGGLLAVRAGRRRIVARRAAIVPGTAVVRGGAVPAARRSEEREDKENWRMPPLAMLAPAPMSLARRIGMSAMYVYLGAAIILVIVRVAQIALGG
ncbi:MAG TPA: NRAMP family divalent metal transporter [Streptosporangiaceae bacterium]|jgi:Mn2+/Fe2+ NRAMP family transporter|nr:NRAMP family divalent metal transporter [Streptosporangiaceae bacterium]